MRESDPNLLNMGPIERLSICAGSGLIEAKWEKDLDELLRRLYPELSSKELCLCKWIIYTIWDLEQGEALYDEVVLRVMDRHKELFHEQQEVDNTILQLSQKGIVYSTVGSTEWSWIPGSARIFTLRYITTSKYLGLKETVRKEAIAAMGECLKSVLDGYLFPR